jgi:GDP-4-dehydro-6-deoxy-D-mannose reductase
LKILVTGANGFVGSYVRQMIPCTGCHVDVRKPIQLQAAIGTCAPDAVIHLAAQSFVPRSFENPAETFDINFLGTFHLLEALKKANFSGTFLYVGSADVYGAVPIKCLPITEDRPLWPRSPYAVSKMAAEALCFQWSLSEPFKIIMARPFNHIGPGQREEFAVSGFAKQLIEIKLGRRKPVLRVGDLEVTRDFTDVRDIVRAYKALLEFGETGKAYNVCSGKELAIKDIVTKLVEIAGLNVTVENDPGLFRLTEQRRHAGCYCRLRRKTGWRPSIEIEQSLREILHYWEKRLNELGEKT